jgi:hypothetical protein
MKRDGPKAPAAVQGPLGIMYHPNEKANLIADCVENQFTCHDLCDENNERRMETLLASVDDTPQGHAMHKLVKSLKLREACGLDGIPNECLRHLPRRPLVHLTCLLNHFLRLSHLPKPWKEAEVITLPKLGEDPKFPQNLRPINLFYTTGKLFEKVILKIVQKHIEERGLLNASQFGFDERQSTTLQFMRLTLSK